MEHEFIIDFSVYYDENVSYRDLEFNWYKCKKCEVCGHRNNSNGEVEVISADCFGLSCEEVIIKSIIE